MEIIIGIAILCIVLFLIFKMMRAIIRTWKISVPVILGLILILIFGGAEAAGGFLGFAVSIGICIIAWANHARCPNCKTFTIEKVGERVISTSGVFQEKCGDGRYHPHQKVTGENIFRCKKCGFEKRSEWTKKERLDV
jgi:hypothetical protein